MTAEGKTYTVTFAASAEPGRVVLEDGTLWPPTADELRARGFTVEEHEDGWSTIRVPLPRPSR